MNKQQAQQIIKETFENPFDKNTFTRFIKNLLNTISDAPFTYQGNYIPDAFKQHIKTLERIGKFDDKENSIDILIVTLSKETSLERARTMQRNFIAWYLNGSRGGEMKDAALAAFVSPGKVDWRFSLIKMDYKFEQTKTGKMKVKEEFTPARRWSFLVGVTEKSHTAQSRLVNILADDKQIPTLEEIEKSFDIETVTKEFFLKYRELFLHTKEELDRVVNKDPKIKIDFDDRGIDTVNFAKKLLGQIVFLYFLQKKGWFGVGRDDDWGTGSKHFLRELFEKKHGDYNNFYNDILEPLFYEVLRIDRSHDDGYYSRFDCKIPFLNGGLFDPIGNYDWVHTDIIILNKLFSNTRKTKEGDTGDGILDIFDRYNFTVKEDEPLEKEVAIDPELLGKAYEKFNAIRPDNFDEFKRALKSGKSGEENKFNKKFGVYYTPREIVHYMCRQSLINYLASELEKKISKEDIEALINTGEHVSENEVRVLRKGKETKTYSHQLSESIRKNAKQINEKLAEITVCDPAVGSGAFPVGMMSEIVRTRNVLSTFVQDKTFTPYEFKRRCIEHSLYGVDIDPGAVEIAKLRLWLSLVVDEDDIKNIKPLPNLDYRIMQGNSLISEFMGISFDTNLKNSEKTSVQTSFLKNETEALVEQFHQKKDEFLNESNVTKKLQLNEEVENLLVKIFETKLKTQKADYFNRLKEIETKHSNWPTKKQRDEYIKQDKEKLYKESGFDLESAEKQLKEFTSGRQIKPFFLWHLYFSEVFHNKGGFDVVIANPPYGLLNKRQNKAQTVVVTPQELHHYKTSPSYEPARGGMINIFKLFIIKSIYLIRKNGILSEIFPLAFIADASASKLRKYILNQCSLRLIEAFPERDNIRKRVFEEVKMSVCVMVLTGDKSNLDDDFFIRIHDDRYVNELNEKTILNSKLIELFDNTNYTIPLMSQNDIDLICKIYKKSNQIGDIGHCYTGEVDMTLGKKYVSHNDNDAVLLRGAGIDRYLIRTQMSQGELLYLKERKYLGNASKEKILHSQSERIVLQAITGVNEKIRLKMTLIDKNMFCANSVNYIILNTRDVSLKYLLGFLNSNLINYIFSKFSTNSNVNGYEVDNLPFPQFTKQEITNRIIQFVDKILSITKTDDYVCTSTKQATVKGLQAEIDQLVYKLYDLTPEEIKIVEEVMLMN